MTTHQTILSSVSSGPAHYSAGCMAYLLDDPDYKRPEGGWQLENWEKGRAEAATDPRYVQLRDMLRRE